MIVARPSIEGRVLEGAGETEGEWPRKRAVSQDFGEICGGLFWSLAARKEDNAGDFSWDMILEGLGGGFANFFWRGLGMILFASEDHVAFNDASRKGNAMIFEFGD